MHFVIFNCSLAFKIISSSCWLNLQQCVKPGSAFSIITFYLKLHPASFRATFPLWRPFSPAWLMSSLKMRDHVKILLQTLPLPCLFLSLTFCAAFHLVTHPFSFSSKTSNTESSCRGPDPAVLFYPSVRWDSMVALMMALELNGSSLQSGRLDWLMRNVHHGRVEAQYGGR